MFVFGMVVKLIFILDINFVILQTVKTNIIKTDYQKL